MTLTRLNSLAEYFVQHSGAWLYPDENDRQITSHRDLHGHQDNDASESQGTVRRRGRGLFHVSRGGFPRREGPGLWRHANREIRNVIPIMQNTAISIFFLCGLK